MLVPFVLIAAVTSLGCSDACESDDDCDEAEYCADEDGGSCREKKGKGAACEESRECADDLVCTADSQNPLRSCQHEPLVDIDWGKMSNCSFEPAPSAGAGGWAGAAIAAALLSLRRRSRRSHRPTDVARRDSVA
jgi:MYXO-CTERM domain-containing protein